MDKNNEMQINYNLLMAKKTEKIVTAIYLISQFLPKEENLKNDLRKESDSLLKDMFALGFSNEENGQNFLLYKKCLDTTSLLISFLYISKISGLISTMNVDIVIESLRMLETILNRKQFSLKKENLLISEENHLEYILSNKSFFQKDNSDSNTYLTSLDVLTERNLNTFTPVTKNKINNIKEIKENNNEEIGKSSTRLIVDETKEKDTVKEAKDFYKRHNYIKDNILKSKSVNKEIKVKNTQNKSAQNRDRKSTRRLQILAIFTKGVEVSINDISKKIVGCSIKTLQRELNDLVLEGKINKLGDKRWSKYTLN